MRGIAGRRITEWSEPQNSVAAREDSTPARPPRPHSSEAEPAEVEHRLSLEDVQTIRSDLPVAERWCIRRLMATSNSCSASAVSHLHSGSGQARSEVRRTLGGEP